MGGDAVSYNRFVELESRVFFPPDVLPKPPGIRQMYGHCICGLNHDTRVRCISQFATLCSNLLFRYVFILYYIMDES